MNPQSTQLLHPATLALLIFFLAIASRELFRHLPESVSLTLRQAIWKSFWIVLCFLGLLLAYGTGLAASLTELGLRAAVGPATAVAFFASLPMLLIFVLTLKVNPHLRLGHILVIAVLGPFCEEVLFRGYLFKQLYDGAGWTFLSAVGVTAGLFGLAHLRNLVRQSTLWQALGEVAMIGVGGAFFAWLFLEWHYNLWVPVLLHGFMNLWCEVFACDAIAGNWRTNGARVFTVFLAIVITVYLGG